MAPGIEESGVKTARRATELEIRIISGWVTVEFHFINAPYIIYVPQRYHRMKDTRPSSIP